MQPQRDAVTCHAYGTLLLLLLLLPTSTVLQLSQDSRL
jgi:hypothetical protein